MVHTLSMDVCLEEAPQNHKTCSVPNHTELSLAAAVAFSRLPAALLLRHRALPGLQPCLPGALRQRRRVCRSGLLRRCSLRWGASAECFLLWTGGKHITFCAWQLGHVLFEKDPGRRCLGRAAFGGTKNASIHECCGRSGPFLQCGRANMTCFDKCWLNGFLRILWTPVFGTSI